MNTISQRWFPPRGAVTLTQLETSWRVDCAACGYTCPHAPYRAIRTDAEDHKRYHRCPPGTPGAVPPGPVCTSTTRRCWDPATRQQTDVWHQERTSLLEGVTP